MLYIFYGRREAEKRYRGEFGLVGKRFLKKEVRYDSERTIHTDENRHA